MEFAVMIGPMMTRRELGKRAAATGASAMLARAQNSPSKYGGALERFESKVDAAAFDPVLYTRKLYESAALRMTYRPQDRKQTEAWQKELRAKLTELLGGFPSTRTELQSQTLEVRDFPLYRREKFV